MGAITIGANAQTLASFEAFQESLRCFDNWLTGVVPGAMDLDCLIERRGNVIVFELKPWKGTGVAVSYGSHLCLRHLAGLDGFTLYLVGEERTAKGTRLHLADYSQAEPTVGSFKGRCEAWFPADQFKDTTIPQLRRLVGAWWKRASATQ